MANIPLVRVRLPLTVVVPTLVPLTYSVRVLPLRVSTRWVHSAVLAVPGANTQYPVAPLYRQPRHWLVVCSVRRYCQVSLEAPAPLCTMAWVVPSSVAGFAHASRVRSPAGLRLGLSGTPT